ncbi:MAG: rhodanese-like domain-containing protein [Deltaproteobacteria bacterium]|nr:rhodanese-like domain-containing protein [Deltaproteobacteria bacterium]
MNRILALLMLALACSATPSQVSEISQTALLAEPTSTLILDVRTAAEFASGHVPGAVNIPHDQLAARLSEVESFRSAPVVVYCKSGRRAGMATSVLADAGFSKLHHLTGDMNAWSQQGLPTEPANAPAP